jgi:peptidoglycan/LPS O-acetylase OafA/YrhL
MPGAWDWLAARRRVSLAVTVLLSIGGLGLLETGIMRRDTPFDAVFANIFTWMWLVVFMGYGRAHLGFSNRLLVWARDASYPVYILHQTVIIVIAYFVIRQPWAPWTKYWVILAGTLVACVLTYEFVLRRSALLRLMFGIKIAAQANKTGASAGPVLRSGTAESA